MPQDQGKLRHLLALLAQLEEGGLARVRLHELRNPLQDALVLLRHDGLVVVALDVVGWSPWDDASTRNRIAVVARHAREVLLLCGRRGDRSSLRLRLMRLELALLVAYMVGRVLLVVLRPLARVLLLVWIDVLHLQAIGPRCRGIVFGRIVGGWKFPSRKDSVSKAVGV
jgi:hypothetical protein